MSLQNKKLLPTLALLVVSAAIASCGFKLRGTSHSIEHIYASMQVIDMSGDDGFRQILEQTLENSGVEIRPESENILTIINSEPSRRTASYSSRGKSAEFELLKDLNYQFTREDVMLIPPTSIQARRTYLYRETEAVGKAEEETLLREEMDLDLAQRIIISLQRSAQASGQ